MPERRTRLQAKIREYQDAARTGKLRDVTGRDMTLVRDQARQLREKGSKAAQVARKGQQVGHVTMSGV